MLNTVNHAQMLKAHLQQYVDFDDVQFQRIQSYFHLHHFKKNQIIIHQHDQVRLRFLISQGVMKLSNLSTEGKEFITQFALEGQWITDLEAFECHTASKFNVECIESCVAWSLSFTDQQQLCAEFPEIKAYFYQLEKASNMLFQKRILCFVRGRAQERLHSLQEDYPGLIDRIPKTMIASYLGISRETLSRIISEQAAL
ncbi:cAMP-binding domain of CRP or a regulatory subunit of cAMP-dependent protein kinases [Acinetobacter marinus]|uniref:cAMP-binding domain of CRP or a regulatory subunit of cAMP-dependent protein kinases n=1 Tax=Acinetobacter marinus TaxID=281375 RepID=A0A1G6LGL3_9GAMM|nr:Crp/Fnr family transcriptional regulator [Acinetobacter marinus]SDC41716.1 cAMP-binding domain of CRP or a regulatory subunit of cAMP-dependent protein kinases [Acinetobacter marinus]